MLRRTKLGVFLLRSSRGQQPSVNETTGGARTLQGPNPSESPIGPYISPGHDHPFQRVKSGLAGVVDGNEYLLLSTIYASSTTPVFSMMKDANRETWLPTFYPMPFPPDPMTLKV